jgi:hypothetical protein
MGVAAKEEISGKIPKNRRANPAEEESIPKVR